VKKQFEPICKKIKDCEKVSVLKTLIITGESGSTPNFQRLMNAQALRDNSMSSYMQPKKTVELNATHSVVARMTNQRDADARDKTTKDMLWDTALFS
jgi:molecular chaperone HtpG